MTNKPLESNVNRILLPLLPLKDIVVFPHMIVPVFINEELCINAVEHSLNNDRKIFLSAFKLKASEEEGFESSLKAPFDVYDVGTICSVIRTRKLPDGRLKVLVQGTKKASINYLESNKNFPMVSLSLDKEEEKTQHQEAEALIRAVKESLEKVVSLGKLLSPDIVMIIEDIKDPCRLADIVAANLGLNIETAQRILSTTDSLERLRKVHSFIAHEIEIYQMQLKIQTSAREEISKHQREHYLKEQIRVLRSELGDYDPKDDIEEIWEKIENAHLPHDAKEEVKKQAKRLERMHQDSSEATITKNYLETVLQLPWNKTTPDTLDIAHVSKILDRDHFGIDQIKERIIEYLAVKKLNAKAKSPILCFIGPPGVGKTSLGKSIAAAMGRNFSRISLGGIRDEADIRGHRKTYVGAYPGRIIQALRKAQSLNPVIMLDEIDKVGSDHRGDPAAALLEVLDPEQNFSFVDHFLNIPFDLSKILFLANANTLDTIPLPLRDRMELIEVTGYSEEEKEKIVEKFILPKQLEESGLNTQSIEFSKSAIHSIIRGYTRESGLRNLERQIATVCRKVAIHVASNLEQQEKQETVRLTTAKIKQYLGVPPYGQGSYNFTPVSGLSFAMAYTRFGGEILPIETSIFSGKEGQLDLTGQLGDVMKESAFTAYSFIKAHFHKLNLTAKQIQLGIHIHMPQGAVPKDGPSAGTAIVTSILSALRKEPIKEHVCMTGEISLHGKVLAIGGLKEKLLAAQREGFKEVILPLQNKDTYFALPAALRKKLTIHFVDDYFEILNLVFLQEEQAVQGVDEHHSLKFAS